MIMQHKKADIKVSDDELLSYFQYKITEVDEKLNILKLYAGDEGFNNAVGLVSLDTALCKLSLNELETKYHISNIVDKIIILHYIKLHLDRIVKGLKNRIEK
nr:MAG TPA: hypothetical protein [Caudoviricetes sp.]